MELDDHELGGQDTMENKQQERSRMAVLVVVKGYSSSDKMAIVRRLVEYLEFPLVDQEDVTATPQNSLPTSSTGKYLINDLAFETVYRITSTQLGFKMGVIVSTPLSRRAQFERLKQLADEKQARMIIVECRLDQEDEYYDVGGIPKLTVDPSNRWDPGKLIASSIRQPEQEFEHWKYYVKREEMLSHLHEIAFSRQLPRNAKRLVCQKCHQLISSGPIYRCMECQELILHKSCAELPDKNVQQLHENCPAYQKLVNPDQNFPRKRTCQACEFHEKGFSYDCFDCLFQTHLECGLLPTVVSTTRHEHLLSFALTPLSYNYGYLCHACDDFGKFISYKCYKCDYDLHTECALLSRKTVTYADEDSDAKVDDFINRFKQRLNLQRLDSI